LGAVQDKEQWRRRWNFELYKLYDESYLAECVKINRIKWAGHVIQMDNNWTTERTFDTRPEGKRGIGSPILRWIMWTGISDL
jgi:hypothetical protein